MAAICKSVLLFHDFGQQYQLPIEGGIPKIGIGSDFERTGLAHCDLPDITLWDVHNINFMHRW